MKTLPSMLFSAKSILLTCALLTGLGFEAGAQQRDPEAAQVAEEMMQAMGGPGAWDNVHFLRFDFIVASGGETQLDRSHLWDKWSGRYRFEHTTKEGEKQVVLFNVNDRQGEVYLDGEQQEGTAAEEALEQAYAAFINDSYWLAMPWKWLDPGVNLKYLGEKEKDGATCDVVELTFGDVGLTPGDTYHAYVAKDSRLMTYWEYTLQSGRQGAWNWEYGQFGGIKLARNHTNAEGRSINMGGVAVLDEVDEAFFNDPNRPLSQLN